MIRTFTAAAVALLAALSVGVAAPASASTAPPIRLAGSTVQVFGPETPVYPSCEVFYSPLSDCGYVDLRLTLTGFDAYGGVRDGLGSVGDTGSASLHALITCGTSSRTHLVKTRLDILPVLQYSEVSRTTRVDSNTAELVAEFELPTPAEYGVCGTQSTNLLRAKVFGITFGYDGAAGTPSHTYRIPGIFGYVA
ncbi:hypothetical protein ACFQ46_23770 [Kineococcus sp. GCM10028916]|uniref:hypothetical protein n=1 Tax=Kineococcus sp. GCM10028916 TaxID=3273394 RepID=UPI0036372433